MQTTTLLRCRAVGASASSRPATVASQLATMLRGDRAAEADLLGRVSRSFDDSDDVAGRSSANAILTGGLNFRVADNPPRIRRSLRTAALARLENFLVIGSSPRSCKQALRESAHTVRMPRGRCL